MNSEVLKTAGKSSMVGAEGTATMLARAGRASYVDRAKVNLLSLVLKEQPLCLPGLAGLAM